MTNKNISDLDLIVKWEDGLGDSFEIKTDPITALSLFTNFAIAGKYMKIEDHRNDKVKYYSNENAIDIKHVHFLAKRYRHKVDSIVTEPLIDALKSIRTQIVEQKWMESVILDQNTEDLNDSSNAKETESDRYEIQYTVTNNQSIKLVLEKRKFVVKFTPFSKEIVDIYILDENGNEINFENEID